MHLETPGEQHQHTYISKNSTTAEDRLNSRRRHWPRSGVRHHPGRQQACLQTPFRDRIHPHPLGHRLLQRTRPVHVRRMLWMSCANSIHVSLVPSAGLAGSIGIAPSSNMHPTRKSPSLFEPVHGSAFDITEKGVANPVATFWSAAEMLTWLGEKEAASKLMGCVERVCEAGILTGDLRGTAKTRDVVDAVCAEIGRLA
ncbi:hypothetical protein BJX61DRAFT_526705 [Aspergillus egyptiacus]|nr:hypothetical protein BJX61DRAFT_526705 [Aspergillus egyptiacus]